MKLMVFDVGGTEIKYCVMDESLVREEAGSVPTPMSSQEEFFDVLCSLYEPHRGEAEGIAMCLPGFIDSENGRCLGGGALRYNQGRDVAGPLSERTGVPVHIANDGKCAALAELRDGALRGCRNASVYIIGTGVGGGLVINGEILNGSHFTAGQHRSAHNRQAVFRKGKRRRRDVPEDPAQILHAGRYADRESHDSAGSGEGSRRRRDQQPADPY